MAVQEAERVRARDRLDLIGDMAAGTGSLRKGQAQSRMRDLERIAGRRSNRQAGRGDLAAMGIAVQEV